MPTAVNLYRERYDVYIGRPKFGQQWRFGNPFRVGRDGGRGECVHKFEKWLRLNDPQCCPDATEERRDWILLNLPLLRGKRLGCFCKPSNCHGEVLARLYEERVRDV